MPLDPDPKVHTVAREHWPRARPPVSNRLWDPAKLLRLALDGAYPSAEGGYSQRAEEVRREEIAYWRRRLEQPAAGDDDLDARPVLEE